MRRWILLLALTCTGPLAADERGMKDVIVPPPPSAPGQGFAHHVREARAINRARKQVYAELSGGLSARASRQLIQGETLTLPFASYYDRAARRFNAAGLGIVRDDFVDMHALPAPETPTRYRRQASAEQKRELKDLLGLFRDELCGLLKAHDFRAATERTRVALGAVQALEREQGVHWAMTVHVLEQVGLSAERAAAYVEADPETAPLARRFVRFLAFGLRTSPRLDHSAQRAHVLGVGVIVNDLPPIPFHASPATAGHLR